MIYKKNNSYENNYKKKYNSKYKRSFSDKNSNFKNNRLKDQSFTIVNSHPRAKGVFLYRKNKDENLVTLSLNPGKSVYNEKRFFATFKNSLSKEKKEFRIWNPYRSKLGASIVNGIKDIFIKPGSKVLYLGAASGTTVSHVADIVGMKGSVYAVEFSGRSARQMVRMAQDRINVIPIFADARLPNTYRLMVPMVDVIFSDVAQPDQIQIVIMNARHFLKSQGWVMIAIKASCVDSIADPEEVYKQERKKLNIKGWQLHTQISLEPYQRHHSMITAKYRPS